MGFMRGLSNDLNSPVYKTLSLVIWDLLSMETNVHFVQYQAFSII